MEARPRCHYCKRTFDPTSGKDDIEHRRVCIHAGLAVALGPRAFGLVMPGDPVITIKYYRPKPRKKSDFKPKG